MNQASRQSWLVPVLPAAGQPSIWARWAVPEVSASDSMAFISPTCSSDTTRPGPEPERL